MNLTGRKRRFRPHRAHRSKATPTAATRSSGQKIFITFVEHDLTDSIVHLVLARTDHGAGGVCRAADSLFLVPKFLVNDDGSLGVHNDRALRVDRRTQMGIRQPDRGHGVR